MEGGKERRDKGKESDKFPADDYLQAIPPHCRNLRPQPPFSFPPLYLSLSFLLWQICHFCIIVLYTGVEWCEALVEVGWRDEQAEV